MKKEKAIDRARKLMAMSGDLSSPKEAAIAAKRARSIMDKHQISIIDLDEESEFGTRTAGSCRSIVPRWEQTIIVAIAYFNDCIVSRQADGRARFKGFALDADLCYSMYYFLIKNGKETCSKFIKDNEKGCHNSFKYGYSCVLSQRMYLISKERRENIKNLKGNSLVLIKKTLVENEFGEFGHIDIKNTRAADSYSYSCGAIAGKDTAITTDIKNKS